MTTYALITAAEGNIYPGASFRTQRCASYIFQHLAQSELKPSAFNSLSPRREQWLSLVSHAETNGFIGITLATSERNRWGFITRDFEDNLKFRYTTFDRRGFIGHGTYNTAEEACIALFDMGFRLIDHPNRLDDVAASCNWYSATNH